MITLITGLPGNGKTLYALEYVAGWAKREGRPVWYYGIKGLSPELGWHELASSVEKLNVKEVTVPHWWLCPAGAIVLIDEAQMCGFGVRPRGVVPEWAQKLEVHRHLGIDVVFITQDPRLLDSHDRSLVEIHFHLMRTFGMQRATVHEFRPVRDDIKRRSGSIQHKWKFPKSVFAWYTSAELHTHKARIPMKVWLLGGVCALIPLIGWYSWAKFIDPHRERPGIVSASSSASSPIGGGGGTGRTKTTADYVREQLPRIEGLAFSAPVYDDVTKPTEAPYPAACVVSVSQGCRCYSQQATRLEVPDKLCRSIVDGGFYVAWQQKAAQSDGKGSSSQPAQVQAATPATYLPAPPEAVSDALAHNVSYAPGRGRALPKLAPPQNSALRNNVWNEAF